MQRLAWMTASLIGFAKVPDYEKVFPASGRARAKRPASSAALFEYFNEVKAERVAKREALKA